MFTGFLSESRRRRGGAGTWGFAWSPASFGFGESEDEPPQALRPTTSAAIVVAPSPVKTFDIRASNFSAPASTECKERLAGPLGLCDDRHR